MLIFFIEKDFEKPNFGIAVGKKIGNAVMRNKMKRIFRNLVDNNRLLFKNYHNYIIMIKKEATNAPYKVLDEEMKIFSRKDKYENKFKVFALVCVLLLTSGCGTSNYIKDDEGNIVEFEETGQMLQKDILCLPEENSELYKLYEENKDQLKYDFEDLPSCSDYSLSSTKSSGLWEFLFVKPLAFLILKLGNLIGNLGVSLILIGLAIRLILLPLQLKVLDNHLTCVRLNQKLKRLKENIVIVLIMNL